MRLGALELYEKYGCSQKKVAEAFLRGKLDKDLEVPFVRDIVSSSRLLKMAKNIIRESKNRKLIESLLQKMSSLE